MPGAVADVPLSPGVFGYLVQILFLILFSYYKADCNNNGSNARQRNYGQKNCSEHIFLLSC